MTKRKDRIHSLRDLDPNEILLHQTLDLMEAVGMQVQVDFLWEYIYSLKDKSIERFSANNRTQDELTTKNQTIIKQEDEIKSLGTKARITLAIANEVTKRRKVESNKKSESGKLSANRHRSLVQEVASATLAKYPFVSKSALAKEIYLYLADEFEKEIPSEETIRTHWLKDVYKSSDVKPKAKSYFRLVFK
ncbi:hypothetical protein [Shewanella sp. 10N.286.54.B9]|uniref:hypothetical protein n=1 Tax=Shewanella sp. 10N.286.54.B9 TaxID=3229719 RepID=UPI00354F7E5E